MTLLLIIRIIAILVGTLTLAFLWLGLTANSDIFLAPDIVLAVLLVGTALLPDQRLAVLGMLVAFAYTAGIFSLSVAIAVVRGPFNAATLVGLFIAVACVLLLGYRCYAERSYERLT
jgi:hypothetical protein